MNIKIRATQPAASKHDSFMKPRHRRNGFVNTVIFFVGVIAVIFVLSIVMRVSEVKVIGNEHYSADEIIKAVGIEEGDNIFFFDRFSAISRVFAKLPYVEEVYVERKLPGTVTITIAECKAMAYIAIGEENWTIDQNCKVLGKANDGEYEGLIPIYGFDPGTLYIGERLTTSDDNEQQVDYLADILNQIQGRELNGNIKRVDVSNFKRVKLYFASKYVIVLGADHNTEHKFGLFLSAISQLKSGDFGTIDVSDDTTAYFTPN